MNAIATLQRPSRLQRLVLGLLVCATTLAGVLPVAPLKQAEARSSSHQSSARANPYRALQDGRLPTKARRSNPFTAIRDRARAGRHAVYSAAGGALIGAGKGVVGASSVVGFVAGIGWVGSAVFAPFLMPIPQATARASQRGVEAGQRMIRAGRSLRER